MAWLVPVIVGWWGTVWWPGIERDAPPKGPLPDPWWWKLAIGVIGGGAAVLVLGASEPMPGVAALSSNPMPGLVVALATGGVTRAVLGAIRSFGAKN